jgi:hypothetical protein
MGLSIDGEFAILQKDICGVKFIFCMQIIFKDLEVQVRFLALPDFLRSSGSGTGSTKPHEYN